VALTVQRFRNSVCHPMTAVGQDIFQMSIEHSGNLGYRLQMGVDQGSGIVRRVELTDTRGSAIMKSLMNFSVETKMPYMPIGAITTRIELKNLRKKALGMD